MEEKGNRVRDLLSDMSPLVPQLQTQEQIDAWVNERKRQYRAKILKIPEVKDNAMLKTFTLELLEMIRYIVQSKKSILN